MLAVLAVLAAARTEHILASLSRVQTVQHRSDSAPLRPRFRHKPTSSLTV